MIDLCKRLGLGWNEDTNTSDVFYIEVPNPHVREVPCVVDHRGNIVTAYSQTKVGLTVLDIFNKSVAVEHAQEVKSIECGMGDEYCTVDFSQEDEPRICLYTFDGDIVDYYNLRSGNMFPPRCHISKELAKAIAKAIVTTGNVKIALSNLETE